MNVLVSVVIPVYNVENYVARCVKSVLNQTYNNLEIIIVNDGSTDNSMKIVYQLVENKPNVVIINQENKGLSEARNSGIDVANGKYIFFLDSDDFIEESVLKLMVEKSEKDEIDILVGKYRIINGKFKKMSTTILDENLIIDELEGLKMLFESGKFHFHAWGKLFRKSLFDKIRFPKNRYYEDIATTYKLFLASNKVSFINISTCEYFMRLGSICNSDFNEKHLDFIINFDEMELYLKENNIYKYVKKEFKTVKLRNYLSLGFYKIATSNNKNKKELLCQLKEKIKDELFDVSIPLNKREKVYRYVIIKSITLYCILINCEAYTKDNIRNLLNKI